MQHFKNQFSDLDFTSTFGNIQRCLRLNDLNEVGDGTHYLDFDMIGLFSFRQWNVKQSIDFFMTFLSRLNIVPDYVTIHPDKYEEWKEYYKDYNIEIRKEPECIWSDGNIGGYCTEFFKDNIEIGNIVNPLSSCIDVGFGLERLILVSNKEINTKRLEILERCCQTIIDSGVIISPYKEGFILRKIITTCILEGSKNSHPFFENIRMNMKNNYRLYLRDKVKPRHRNKDNSYWKISYGIDPDLCNIYENL